MEHDSRPRGFTTPDERTDALHDAARGLDLDGDEELMLATFAHLWSSDVTERMCSLMEKIREAGYLTRLDESPLAPRPAPTPGVPGRYIPSNSGPGF